MGGHGASGRVVGWLLALLPLLAGCDAEGPTPAAVETTPAPATPGTNFDPSLAGRVSGRVVWGGPAPSAPPFQLMRLTPQSGFTVEDRVNPLVPTVSASGGLGGAVVHLECVDARRSRPWQHPPVSVEMSDAGQVVRQGEGPARWSGFVRAGDAVNFVSTQAVPHMAQVRGAAFFTLALPEPWRPSSRRLNKPGLVEVSSASGYHWLRGYLFVADHPYSTRTGPDGTFSLEGVPPGRYELTCRVPDWTPAGHDRDPETLLVFRTHFPSPRSRTQSVTVDARGNAVAEFTWSAADFR